MSRPSRISFAEPANGDDALMADVASAGMPGAGRTGPRSSLAGVGGAAGGGGGPSGSPSRSPPPAVAASPATVAATAAAAAEEQASSELDSVLSSLISPARIMMPPTLDAVTAPPVLRSPGPRASMSPRHRDSHAFSFGAGGPPSPTAGAPSGRMFPGAPAPAPAGGFWDADQDVLRSRVDRLWRELQTALTRAREAAVKDLRGRQSKVITAVAAVHQSFADEHRHPLYDVEARMSREQRIAAAKESAVASVVHSLASITGGRDIGGSLASSMSLSAIPSTAALGKELTMHASHGLVPAASVGALGPGGSAAAFIMAATSPLMAGGTASPAPKSDRYAAALALGSSATAPPSAFGRTPGLAGSSSVASLTQVGLRLQGGGGGGGASAGASPAGRFTLDASHADADRSAIFDLTALGSILPPPPQYGLGSVSAATASASSLAASASSGTLLTVANSVETGHAVMRAIMSQAEMVQRIVSGDTELLVAAASNAMQRVIDACLADFRSGLHVLVDVARDHIEWLKRRHDAQLRDLRASIAQQIHDMMANTRAEMKERLKRLHVRNAQALIILKTEYEAKMQAATMAYKGVMSQVKEMKGYNDALKECILAIGAGAGIPSVGLTNPTSLNIMLASNLDVTAGDRGRAGGIGSSADTITRTLEDIMNADEAEAASVTFGRGAVGAATIVAKSRRRSSMAKDAASAATGVATTPSGGGGDTGASPGFPRRRVSAVTTREDVASRGGGFSSGPSDGEPAVPAPVGVVIKNRTMRVVTLPDEADSSKVVAAIVARVLSLTHAEQDNRVMKEHVVALEARAMSWEQTAKEARYSLLVKEGEVRELTDEKTALTRKVDSLHNDVAKQKEQARGLQGLLNDREDAIRRLESELERTRDKVEAFKADLMEARRKAEAASFAHGAAAAAGSAGSAAAAAGRRNSRASAGRGSISLSPAAAAATSAAIGLSSPTNKAAAAVRRSSRDGATASPQASPAPAPAPSSPSPTPSSPQPPAAAAPASPQPAAVPPAATAAPTPAPATDTAVAAASEPATSAAGVAVLAIISGAAAKEKASAGGGTPSVASRRGSRVGSASGGERRRAGSVTAESLQTMAAKHGFSSDFSDIDAEYAEATARAGTSGGMGAATARFGGATARAGVTSPGLTLGAAGVTARPPDAESGSDGDGTPRRSAAESRGRQRRHSIADDGRPATRDRRRMSGDEGRAPSRNRGRSRGRSTDHEGGGRRRGSIGQEGRRQSLRGDGGDGDDRAGISSSLMVSMGALEASLGDDVAAQLARARAALEFRKKAMAEQQTLMRSLEESMAKTTHERDHARSRLSALEQANTALHNDVVATRRALLEAENTAEEHRIVAMTLQARLDDGDRRADLLDLELRKAQAQVTALVAAATTVTLPDGSKPDTAAIAAAAAAAVAAAPIPPGGGGRRGSRMLAVATAAGSDAGGVSIPASFASPYMQAPPPLGSPAAAAQLALRSPTKRAAGAAGAGRRWSFAEGMPPAQPSTTQPLTSPTAAATAATAAAAVAPATAPEHVAAAPAAASAAAAVAATPQPDAVVLQPAVRKLTPPTLPVAIRQLAGLLHVTTSLGGAAVSGESRRQHRHRRPNRDGDGSDGASTDGSASGDSGSDGEGAAAPASSGWASETTDKQRQVQRALASLSESERGQLRATLIAMLQVVDPSGALAAADAVIAERLSRIHRGVHDDLPGSASDAAAAAAPGGGGKSGGGKSGGGKGRPPVPGGSGSGAASKRPPSGVGVAPAPTSRSTASSAARSRKDSAGSAAGKARTSPPSGASRAKPGVSSLPSKASMTTGSRPTSRDTAGSADSELDDDATGVAAMTARSQVSVASTASTARSVASRSSRPTGRSGSAARASARSAVPAVAQAGGNRAVGDEPTPADGSATERLAVMTGRRGASAGDETIGWDAGGGDDDASARDADAALAAAAGRRGRQASGESVGDRDSLLLSPGSGDDDGDDEGAAVRAATGALTAAAIRKASSGNGTVRSPLGRGTRGVVLPDAPSPSSLDDGDAMSVRVAVAGAPTALLPTNSRRTSAGRRRPRSRGSRASSAASRQGGSIASLASLQVPPEAQGYLIMGGGSASVRLHPLLVGVQLPVGSAARVGFGAAAPQPPPASYAVAGGGFVGSVRPLSRGPAGAQSDRRGSAGDTAAALPPTGGTVRISEAQLAPWGAAPGGGRLLSRERRASAGDAAGLALGAHTANPLPVTGRHLSGLEVLTAGQSGARSSGGVDSGGIGPDGSVTSRLGSNDAAPPSASVPVASAVMAPAVATALPATPVLGWLLSTIYGPLFIPLPPHVLNAPTATTTITATATATVTASMTVAAPAHHRSRRSVAAASLSPQPAPSTGTSPPASFMPPPARLPRRSSSSVDGWLPPHLAGLTIAQDGSVVLPKVSPGLFFGPLPPAPAAPQAILHRVPTMYSPPQQQRADRATAAAMFLAGPGILARSASASHLPARPSSSSDAVGTTGPFATLLQGYAGGIVTGSTTRGGSPPRGNDPTLTHAQQTLMARARSGANLLSPIVAPDGTVVDPVTHAALLTARGLMAAAATAGTSGATSGRRVMVAGGAARRRGGSPRAADARRGGVETDELGSSSLNEGGMSGADSDASAGGRDRRARLAVAVGAAEGDGAAYHVLPLSPSSYAAHQTHLLRLMMAEDARLSTNAAIRNAGLSMGATGSQLSPGGRNRATASRGAAHRFGSSGMLARLGGDDTGSATDDGDDDARIDGRVRAAGPRSPLLTAVMAGPPMAAGGGGASSRRPGTLEPLAGAPRAGSGGAASAAATAAQAPGSAQRKIALQPLDGSTIPPPLFGPGAPSPWLGLGLGGAVTGGLSLPAPLGHDVSTWSATSPMAAGAGAARAPASHTGDGASLDDGLGPLPAAGGTGGLWPMGYAPATDTGAGPKRGVAAGSAVSIARSRGTQMRGGTLRTGRADGGGLGLSHVASASGSDSEAEAFGVQQARARLRQRREKETTTAVPGSAVAGGGAALA